MRTYRSDSGRVVVRVALPAASVGVMGPLYDALRVVALMTDDFAGQYNELFDAGIGQLITELDATLQAEILDVFVAEVDGDRAQAVVSANTSATSPQGTFDLTGYILVGMERTGSDWLVSSVLTLAPPVSEGDQGEAPTTPTTGG